VLSHENGLTTSNYTELKMAINIIAELEKSNTLIDAIRATAQMSINQSFPEKDPPEWAIVIALLGKMAADELEHLHNRLSSTLTPQGNAPHA
jgi:hypothetical protein